MSLPAYVLLKYAFFLLRTTRPLSKKTKYALSAQPRRFSAGLFLSSNLRYSKVGGETIGTLSARTTGRMSLLLFWRRIVTCPQGRQGNCRQAIERTNWRLSAKTKINLSFLKKWRRKVMCQMTMTLVSPQTCGRFGTCLKRRCMTCPRNRPESNRGAVLLYQKILILSHLFTFYTIYLTICLLYDRINR